MFILTRYLLKDFLRSLTVALSFFALLIILSNFLEGMDSFLQANVAFSDVLLYLLLSLPDWLMQTLPVAVLLSTVFVLGNMQRNGEINAILAAGIPPLRFIRPLFMGGIIITLSAFMAREYLLPKFNDYSSYLYRIKIRHYPEFRQQHWVNFTFRGKDGAVFHIRHLDASQKRLEEVTVDFFTDKGKLRQEIYAKEARWKNEQWVFYEGIIREFSSVGTKTIHFQQRKIYLSETPETLTPEAKKPEEQTLRELWRYINYLKERGRSPRSANIEFQFRIAQPVANFLVVLLGVGFSLGKRYRGRLKALGSTLLVSFVYWGVLSLSRAFAEADFLYPVIAAWLANILFLSYGLLLYRRIRC